MFSGGALRRYGPARCTQIALAAAGIACLLMVTAGLAGAVLGSFLIGLGYGLTNPAASQVLARLTPPERRNRVFAIKQTGVPIGGALAGALLPGLALSCGWRGTVAGVGAVLLLAVLGVFRLPPGLGCRTGPDLPDRRRLGRRAGGAAHPAGAGRTRRRFPPPSPASSSRSAPTPSPCWSRKPAGARSPPASSRR